MSKELKYKIGWDGREVETGVPRTITVLASLEEKLKDTREAITSLNAWLDVAGKSFGKIQSVAETAWDFAKQGAELAKARDSFMKFAGSVGQSSDEIIASLKKASGGTVGELELIQQASKAMSLGVATNSKEMASLMEIARNKGAIMGRTTKEAFDDIVTGIGRMSPQILDNLGIRIPDSFKATTKGMSDTRKMALLTRLTIEEGNKELRAMGGTVETAADQMAAFEVAISDTKKEIGILLSNGLGPTVGFINSDVIPAIGTAITYWKDWLGITDSQTEALARQGKAGQIAIKEMEKSMLTAQKLQADMEIKNRQSSVVAAKERIDKETARRASQIIGTEPLGKYDMGNFAAQQMLPDAKTIQEFNEFEKVSHNAALQIIAINKELEHLKKSGPEAATKTVKGIKDAGNEGDKTSKKLKETKAAAYDLGKALQTAFSSGQEYAEKDTFGRLISDLGVAFKYFQQFEDAIGTTKLRGVTSMMEDLANSVGQFTVEIKKAYEYARQEYRKSTLELTPEKAWDLLNKHVTSITGGVSLPAKGVTLDTEKIENKILQEHNAAIERFKEKLTINVADAFETGLYDGLNGGNFLDSFGKALRSQVARAFAASVTANLFQGGGSFQIGGGAGSGFSPFNPATWIPAATSAMAPQQQQSAGTGTLGALLNFGPMMKGGQPQWGNLTQYAAAGAALQFLTSPGRLFGGTVVHGQEAVQQASDINARVSQARTDRNALIGTVGLSDDTVKKLSDLVFWTAGYNANESGDGWFKGPETTTYELNATQANAALEEFTHLTKQAQIDLAKRAYEIGTTQLDRPFTALQMSLDDLRDALARTVDEESRYALQLQIKQAESQKQSFWAGNLNDWTSFLLSTPMAGKGPGKNLTYSPGFEGVGFPVGQQNYNTDPFQMAFDAFERGFGKVVDIFQAKVGNTVLGPEEFESWAGTQVMMQGLRNQGSSAWDIQEQIARGAKPWDVTIGATGEKYTEILSERIGSYQTMLDELDEKISDETLSMAQRSQLFSQFTAALTAYYGAKQEALDLELQQEADLKNKRDQRTDDILGTLLTRVGEISTNKAGQQILVLSPGQPDGRALVKTVIDAITGENPELAAAITKLVNQNAKPYF